VSFERRELFQAATRKAAADDEQLREIVSDGVTLNPDKPAVQKILRGNVEFLTLPLPDGKGGTLELELAKVNILAPGFSVKTSSPTDEAIDNNPGVHYRGIIKGNDQSLAAVSVFKNEVMGFYSTPADGNFVLGRLGGDNAADKHILYAEKDLKISSNFDCDTKDGGIRLPASVLQEPDEIMARCVRIYLEANYDIFLDKGSSIANVTAYVAGMFNQSATIFANDGIPVAMSQIFVWNSQSPYTTSNSSDLLALFKTNRPSFNGDFAHLLHFMGGGGRASIPQVCDLDNSYAVSGIESTYQTVPTYSWTIFVFTHEAGHNLGSPHTHECAWNGNNTAIDSCGTPVGCASPEVPSGGGTIMSYCNTNNVGINFTLGFGTQPRNLIVNRFNNAYCLTDCDSDCSYSLSPQLSYFPPVGGSGSFNVTAGASCAWTATFLETSLLEIFSPFRQEKLFSPLEDSTSEKVLTGSSSSTGSVGAPGAIFQNRAPVIIDDGNLGVSWITITSGSSGTGNGTVDFTVAANTSPKAARSARILIGNRLHTIFQEATPAPQPRQFDFDGDQKSDLSVFRPSDGYWYINNSSNNSLTAVQFGASGDLLVPEDFDGDDKTDISVFRPSNGTWYRLNSTDNSFSAAQFGANGDVPSPGDFDADSKADIAVYRPSEGIWYRIDTRNNEYILTQFGAAGDKPVVGDYDNDDHSDIAVFRPNNGTWYIKTRVGFTSIQFGNSTDKLVVGDYDGDGKSDPAVYRPSDATWYLLRSTQGFAGVQFGLSTDMPAPGDYDGDGKTDLGVYRSNTWYLLQSTQGLTSAQFGANGDWAVPNSFVR
ncbi:MAG TPA: M12 family metallo-peptidase, partial [Pyrinomonadaceae bacterium]